MKNIEQIEKLIKEGTRHKLNKDGAQGIHSMLGDNTHSRVYSKQYLIFTNGFTIAVKLGFDYRDDTGDIHLRDDKAWKLAAVIPDMANSMSRLYPIYSTKRRGEFLKAMDKLLE